METRTQIKKHYSKSEHAEIFLRALLMGTTTSLSFACMGGILGLIAENTSSIQPAPYSMIVPATFAFFPAVKHAYDKGYEEGPKAIHPKDGLKYPIHSYLGLKF